MSNFIFTTDDLKLIGSKNIQWKSKKLQDLKRRIKDHLLLAARQKCVYCRRSMWNEFSYVIDIEHVLPKSVFPGLRFDLINLAVACKRCNMQLKGAKWNFVGNRTKLQVLKSHSISGTYEIIHPNVDNYYEHIDAWFYAHNDTRVTKYVIKNGSKKGGRTYEMFKLNELEVDDLDESQGAVRARNRKIYELVKSIS